MNILYLHRVFHGIRFKVRGLVVVRQLIFFIIAIPTIEMNGIGGD